MKKLNAFKLKFNSGRALRTLGALTGVAMLAACSAGGAQAGAEASGTPESSAASNDLLAQVKEAGKLRIGLEGTYKPYSFHDESGKLTGIETDISALIAKDLGVEPEYVETKWDSLIAGLDVGRYDIVINDIQPTPERAEKYDFSEPYIQAVGKVVVKEDSPLQKLEDIKGATAAQTPSSNWGVTAGEMGAQVVAVGGFTEAIELVKTGRAQAHANSLVTLQTYLQDHPDSGLRLLEGEITQDNSDVILLPKGADTLREAVNASLQKHLENGDLAQIFEKYVGSDLSPKA